MEAELEAAADVELKAKLNETISESGNQSKNNKFKKLKIDMEAQHVEAETEKNSSLLASLTSEYIYSNLLSAINNGILPILFNLFI